MNKIHRLLADACVQALTAILRKGAVADREVARVLKTHPKWGSRDRGFFAETVFEVVRWQRRFAWLAGSDNPLHLAAWHWTRRGFSRPEWAEWPAWTPEEVASADSKLAGAPRAVRESVSDAADEMAAGELGPRWDRDLVALNQAAPVFLRINPLRTTTEKLVAELDVHGLRTAPVEGMPLALRVLDGKSVPARLREAGRFEIQDISSQLVVPFLEADADHHVIDACAGAGGKTLHLGAVMRGRGRLLAMDIVPAKLETLRNRAARAGVKVDTAAVTLDILKQFAATADRVLVDAPCSGSGTFRRQPDLKYRITRESLALDAARQREVLAAYAGLVRPGGKLVYATCSIFPRENEQQARWFSAQRPDFQFEEEQRIAPGTLDGDGFYMARWERTW